MTQYVEKKKQEPKNKKNKNKGKKKTKKAKAKKTKNEFGSWKIELKIKSSNTCQKSGLGGYNF